MNDSSRQTSRRRGALWPVWLTLLGLATLYGLTLARAPLPGDPTEYTFVAHVLGIAHPPGYALLTLLGNLFQTALPVGDAAGRMHVLGAAAALTALAALLATVRAALHQAEGSLWAALWGILTVGVAADFWQHAIHANPHILTAAFLALQMLTLTRWSVTQDARWLYAWCLVVGLGVTHHPLTIFAAPAEAIFVLTIRPKILLSPRTLLLGLGWAALGLLPWLYFPWRSPHLAGTQFPSDLNSLNGFLNVALARGLRVNLFHFGWADQLDRAQVFWSLLRLQYSLPVIALALVGVGWLAYRPARRPLLWLYLGAGLSLYAFVINTVQDVMAYLLGPFMLVGLLATLGVWACLMALRRRWPTAQRLWGGLALIALLLWGPGLSLGRNLPAISLRPDQEGRAYIEAVFDFFAGTHSGAALLNDWEHMTPLWYAQGVEGRWPASADVRPIFVSSAKPWIEHVFEQLPGGPVYLNGFRREIFDAGFRLRPRGPFYQVVEPGDTTVPPELTPVHVAAEAIDVLAYSLPATPVSAGAYVPFNLALRTPAGTGDVYLPALQVGPLNLPFTTDSHLLTTQWQPGEVVVEAYPFALPWTLPPGAYPVSLRLHNLSADRDTGLNLSLGVLTVTAPGRAAPSTAWLANFRQRVGLVGATARLGQRRVAPWSEPIVAQVGDVVHLTLTWQSLALAEESYTVFVHVIDWGNRPIIDTLDYTPLGGAAPTHLWFPKWLPGQQYRDPYRIPLTNVPPGQYAIEVGLYEMTSRRRLLLSDPQGNLVGDRYILGPLVVQP